MSVRLYITCLLLVSAALLAFPPGAATVPTAAPQIETVSNASDYFPDTQGSIWRYRGHVTESPLQKVADLGFVNVSTVKGTEKVRGVTVKVFNDTNPGNHGPSDSYYRRDAAGIVYYGSDPGTTLEKQLVPYQIVRFPLQFPSSFEQFNRKGLNFGSDLDGDDTNEQADVAATVVVIGKESVTVPAGTYSDAIKIEARMTIRIQLSGGQQIALGSDNMTAWFARGVGLVKYVERQQIPPLKTDRGWLSEITEELEEVTIKPGPDSASVESAVQSAGRCEAPADGVFAHDPRNHELRQVILATGFCSHSR
jgi:hypothetical protein